MARKWKAPLAEPAPARGYLLAAYDDAEAYAEARKLVAKRFGRIDYETQPIAATERESLYGLPARREARVLSFERPVGREEMVDVRRKTLSLENELQRQGRPMVELDPGYVAEFIVVRTAIADDFHRIYLYGGIYAETLFYFEKLSFRPFLHTAPFFREKEMLAAFNDLRLILLSS